MTVSDTSETFLVATSVNFQPTSATLLVNFEAPKENADQLWKEAGDSVMTVVKSYSEAGESQLILESQLMLKKDFLICCKITWVRAVENWAHFY